MSARVVVGAATAVLVVVYAVGAGWWVSVEPGWYRSLVRPWWQPPDAVFGIVWPYNFAALVAAGWALVGAAALTVPLVVVAWRARTWAGLALLPYQLWLCVAASLAFGYAARN
jgi:tryptophan-rich sensory protein